MPGGRTVCQWSDLPEKVCSVSHSEKLVLIRNNLVISARVCVCVCIHLIFKKC